MDRVSELYDTAEKSGIEVLSFPLPETGSLSIEQGGRCYIGIDSSRKLTRAEEAARLGHELGHCLYGGFYTRATPYDLMERHEVRADHWYILHAIPEGRLMSLLQQGLDAWEIAEELDTTEEYVRRAYYFYKDRRGGWPCCEKENRNRDMERG